MTHLIICFGVLSVVSVHDSLKACVRFDSIIFCSSIISPTPPSSLSVWGTDFVEHVFLCVALYFFVETLEGFVFIFGTSCFPKISKVIQVLFNCCCICGGCYTLLSIIPVLLLIVAIYAYPSRSW